MIRRSYGLGKGASAQIYDWSRIPRDETNCRFSDKCQWLKHVSETSTYMFGSGKERFWLPNTDTKTAEQWGILHIAFQSRSKLWYNPYFAPARSVPVYYTFYSYPAVNEVRDGLRGL